MPDISEFILNLSNPILAYYQRPDRRTGDLVIFETFSDARFHGPLDPAIVSELRGEGRIVIGYLNVAVTDHNRTYWNDSWVTYSDSNNRDVGPIVAGSTAPDWLRSHHEYATDPDGTVHGYIVDYTDALWQQRVIDEAVHLVTPVAQGGLGYSGVFLDDVGRYYQAAANDPSYDTAQAAQDMVAFLGAITSAVRAVAPGAYIAINGGAYLGWDTQDQATALATLAVFQQIDALMMESQFGTGAWADVLANGTHWGFGQDFLAVEHLSNAALQPGAFAAWARANGIVPHVAVTPDYDRPAMTPPPGTAGADLLYGGVGPNLLNVMAGNDTVFAGGGNDTVNGGLGDDVLHGQAGDDDLIGSFGDDLLFGGPGADHVVGGYGTDTAFYYAFEPGVLVDLHDNSVNAGGALGDELYQVENLHGTDQADELRGTWFENVLWGAGGADTLHGRHGNDTLVGGDGDDVLIGGVGRDVLNGGPGIDRAHYYVTDAGFIADLAMPGVNTFSARGDTYLSIENLHGGNQSDDLRGDAGGNVIWGAGGDDTIHGRGGNDTLLGQAGDDVLIGGPGGDVLNGGPGIDRAHYYVTDAGFIADLAMPGLNTGAAAGDTYVSVENLHGGNQDDDLRGDGGDNVIWGAGGDDTLRGREGDDLLVGQAGADTFIYADGWDRDTIAGFQDGIDRIQLLNVPFATSAEALAAADQLGAHVVLDLGNGNILTVFNTTLAALADDLFV
ncbi:hypothetical protein [Maliponia aquimaris]|uniref:Bifunctional hemolysin/adenylate cyclase n=1 Tax=Maliponia aquimaris TaxID=1673631 RepID=A0A238KXU7_9RHOB|nr:hypothetical protein [Maliponia aquimaris]SMX47633.1 Bifunctional hemolysin/adenylate cyclase precursor [Maliponia aquimaris]